MISRWFAPSVLGPCAVLAGCSMPSPPAAIPALSFSCPPAGTETVTQRADGSRYRTRWLGADPSDPLVCDSSNGAGSKTRGRLFGRWDVATLGGTAEEQAGRRSDMAAFLSGQAAMAGFIQRGSTGEQTTQHWRAVGGETLDIGGRQVPTVVLSVNYTYAGNGRPWTNRLWFAPQSHLFVKSDASLDSSPIYTWQVVRIIAPKATHDAPGETPETPGTTSDPE